MKRNLKNTVLIVISLVLLEGIISGCKRYPDGPLISLKSKKERVVNVWDAELISINDRDVTKEYNEYTIDFRDDNTFSWKSSLLIDSTNVNTLEGTWEFGGLKQELVLTTESTGVFDVSLLYIEILRLKEKEMWIRFTSEEGDKNYIRLEPK